MAAANTELQARALAAKQAAFDTLRELYRLRGRDVAPSATMLELLSPSVIDDADILHALHYVRILGTNAEHGERVRKREVEMAEQNLVLFRAYVDFECGGTGENGERGENGETGERRFERPAYLSEAATRRLYIDAYLAEAGWEVLDAENVVVPEKAGVEIEVTGMPNPTGLGYCDYVLYGRDGKPLAVVEAKRTTENAEKGRHQVTLYGECLKAKYGYVPVLYYTNGYDIFCIDGLYPDSRPLSGFHRREELERMIQRRGRGSIADTRVNTGIAGRPYQQIAIRSVCERFNANQRRALLVMATGTGKTRVSIALTELLQRNNWVKSVLFLADRTSLVGQAKRNFTKLLPDQTFCELSSSDPDKDLNARIMFSTYQTMINYVDGEQKQFGIGRFDLVIIDEAHRSVFNKYGAIFRYFDSLLVGLTATPRGEVEKSTYQLFDCENGVPTSNYPYEEAKDDHWLVPYTVSSHTTKLMREGVPYAALSERERRAIEEAYGDDPPDVLPNSDLFKILFNEKTCDLVLENLMENGLKVKGGDVLGKSIVFAYNHKHAQLVVDRFNALYPHLPNACRLIDNQVKYADDLIVRFGDEKEGGDPTFRIAVSVDMLDTGIDVTEVTNLVFFKPVKSAIKFHQMIGRGTRLCPGLGVLGQGEDKEAFKIFDYCGNFEYFSENPTQDADVRPMTLTERLFNLRVSLAFALQDARHQQDEWKIGYRTRLADALHGEVSRLHDQTRRIAVRNALAHLDNFRDRATWDALNPVQVKELELHIAPLTMPADAEDEAAKVFDARMFKIEVALLASDGIDAAARDVEFVRRAATQLMGKASIPAVRAKLDVLERVRAEAFWQQPSAKGLEEVREELRDLIKFLDGDARVKVTISVDDTLEDGKGSTGGIIDIRTYRQKVIDYLAENADLPVIRKIKNLEKVNDDDLRELEHILWHELGTKDDYVRTTRIENLAAFVRSIVGLEQAAVNEKLGRYLNNPVLTSQQQEFLKTIVDYVRENGDITRADLLEASPFAEFDFAGAFGASVGDVTGLVDALGSVIAVPVGFFDYSDVRRVAN